jgi:hypothetical protein
MSKTTRLQRRIRRTRRRVAKWRSTGQTRFIPRAKAFIARLVRALKRVKARLIVDWNGHPPLRVKRLRKAVRVAARYGLVVTSTTGGTHAPTSWHYKGRAVDLASGSVSDMAAAQAAIDRVVGRTNLLELFGPGRPNVKNGSICPPIPDHRDHVHVAA